MNQDYQSYIDSRRSFWDTVWEKFKNKNRMGGFYHNRLVQVYNSVIHPDSSVLEIGCGNGKLIGRINGGNKAGIDEC